MGRFSTSAYRQNHKYDPSETLVYNFSVQDLVNPNFDVSAHANTIGREYRLPFEANGNEGAKEVGGTKVEAKQENEKSGFAIAKSASYGPGQTSLYQLVQSARRTEA